MKKLMLTIVAAALVSIGTANAQTETTTKTKAKGEMKDQPMQSNALRDGVMMQNGKLIVMKEGQASVMAEDMTLSNGAIVMKDGSVKMKDGSTMMLKNGDQLDMMGTMTHNHAGHSEEHRQDAVYKATNQGEMKPMDKKQGSTKVKIDDEQTKVKTSKGTKKSKH
jgi:hypothetical protein